MTKLNGKKSASNKEDLQKNIGRRPQILKMEYLSNHWSNLPPKLKLNCHCLRPSDMVEFGGPGFS